MKSWVGALSCLIAGVLAGTFWMADLTRPETKQLTAAIGQPFVDAIGSAKTMTVVRLTPEGKRAEEMNLAAVKAVQGCLLNDEHYIFDRTKQCRFVSEIDISVGSDNALRVAVSLSSKQIKFIEGKKTTILDCDPMADSLKALFDKAVR